MADLTPYPGLDAIPVRIQRQRLKGWRMPPNTVYVGRPSRWGNPWTVEGWRSALDAVNEYRKALENPPTQFFVEIVAQIGQLRGKNLACWCPLDQPCHADVLLEIANDH